MSKFSLHVDTGLQKLRRFASLRGTKQSRDEAYSADDTSSFAVTLFLVCFVVPPRNDAKRQICLSYLCKPNYQTLIL